MRRALLVIAIALVWVQPARGEDARLPVPSQADQATVRQKIQEKYKSQYATLRQVSQVTFGDTLLSAAEQSDNIERFVYLTEARDVATRGGDLYTAWRASQKLSDQYQITPAQARLGIFMAATDWISSQDETNAYLTALVSTLDDAVMNDDFETASALLKLGQAAAQNMHHSDWGDVLAIRRKNIEVQLKAYDAIKPIIAAVGDNPPTSREARLIGSYDCFIKGDWDNGLPLLLQCDDPKLAELARRDLHDPINSEAQLRIADGWYDLAKSPDVNPIFLRWRAFDRYQRYLPFCPADDKSHVKDRIAELKPAISSRMDEVELWLAARDAMLRQSFQETKLVGGAVGIKTFQEIPNGGAALIGFRYGFDKDNPNVVTFGQGIYLTPRGEVLGPPHGNKPDMTQTVRAPHGYAIGRMTVRGAGGLDAFSIIFMRIDGDHLVPDDGFSTASIGGSGGNESTLDGAGTPVIGIFGNTNRDDDLAGLGLIFMHAPAETKSHTQMVQP